MTNANCNSCHYSLSAHGDIRNQTEYCILCHNPTATDAARRPADQQPPQSIDFPVLIHRIHTGDEAVPDGQLTPFIVFGFGNTPNDFSDVRFPGDRRDCAKCHVNDSQQLPLPESRIPVTNPRAFINPSGPTQAACLACHTSRAASSHALSNSTPQLGEACAVCHGPNAEFSVDREHAPNLVGAPHASPAVGQIADFRATLRPHPWSGPPGQASRPGLRAGNGGIPSKPGRQSGVARPACRAVPHTVPDPQVRPLRDRGRAWARAASPTQTLRWAVAGSPPKPIPAAAAIGDHSAARNSWPLCETSYLYPICHPTDAGRACDFSGAVGRRREHALVMKQ